MEDNEVYGMPESKTFTMIKRIIKTLVVAFIFVFIGAFILRIMFADYYPKSMKKLYFTDELTAHYNSDPDGFAAYRLDPDYRYTPDLNSDGENVGNFFAANLIFVPENNSVQCFVRFNRATIEKLNEEYGLSLSEEDVKAAITYSLFASHGEGEDGEAYTGQAYQTVYQKYDKIWIYNYAGLCFEGVDIENAYWMRLEIRLAETGELIGTIPLYDAERDGNDFDKIKFKKSELPK